jgi:hypothetical protein
MRLKLLWFRAWVFLVVIFVSFLSDALGCACGCLHVMC